MKSVVLAGIVVAGAVAAFGIYTFGWRDSDETPRGPSPNAQRVYVLRDGDVVLRPESATRCEASAEGGRRNLFCTRIRGGRHQVILYDDYVLVWPLARGPDGPPFSYRWKP